jgi:hypothetical protein
LNPASISLRANDTDVPVTRSSIGSTVTLTPTGSLETGTKYIVSVSPDLKATDGSPAVTATYEFTSFGRKNAIPPQLAMQLSYFPFSGDMTDAVGTHSPAASDIRNLDYTTDRFGFTGLAGNFNGTTSIVELPNGNQYMANNNLTVSVWINADPTKNGQFVLGLAAWKGFYLELSSDWAWIKFLNHYSQAAGGTSSDENWFPGTGLTKDNGGWQGWTVHKDVLPHNGGVGNNYFKGRWAHVVCTYMASNRTATMYINGEKVKQHDFDLWPAADLKRTISGVSYGGNITAGGNKLALGFIQGSQNRSVLETWADPSDIYSNHFKGAMDDLRIFSVALTDMEVEALYLAEKP